MNYTIKAIYKQWMLLSRPNDDTNIDSVKMRNDDIEKWVHHLPALVGAVDLGTAHVNILTSAEALVTGVGPPLAECLEKKVVLTEIAAYHLSAAILFLAADIVTT